jgi:RNA polymerase sigma factor (sigma-70 family)
VANRLASVLEQFRPRIYRWARLILGHHHDAQDVAQEVLLRLVRVAGTASEPTNPEAWLRRVTYNAAIDRTRCRRASALPDEIRLRPVGKPVAARLAHSELRQQIVSALAELTEQQRLVLCAKVFDELSFAQIAEQMELAAPTVKTHYLRAVRMLRSLLISRGLEDLTDELP